MTLRQLVLSAGFVAALLLIGCGGGGGSGTTSASTATTGIAMTTIVPANVIVYAVQNPSSTDLHYIKPDGTGDTLFETLSSNVQSLAVNPALTNEVVFSYEATGATSFGLYRNGSPTLTGATTIIDPSQGFADILSIQVSPDGSTVYFIGTTNGGAGTLYSVPLAGGSTTTIDQAEKFALNDAGSELTYDKLNGVNADIYIRSTLAGSTSTNLTNSASDDIDPQWSKDGATVVFSSDRSGTNHGIFTIPMGGGSTTTITPTSTNEDLGGSFSPDGSSISFVSLSVNAAQSGIYKISSVGGGTQQQLVANQSVGDSTFWTSNANRGRTPALRLSFGRRKIRRP